MSVTLLKIKQKLLERIKSYIPFNSNLRPEGLYENDSEGVNIIDIFPQYKTKLVVSQPFFSKISPFTIYDQKNDDECSLSVTTDYKVFDIKNGRIFSNNKNLISIISEGNRLIGEASFQYRNGKTVTPPYSPIFQQKYFPKPTHYKGCVFNMLAGGGASKNYGHWLIDSIPRIYLLKKSGLFNQVDYFLVPQYKYDYHIQSLEIFGIKKEQIIRGNDELHITADRIISSTHPRGHNSFLIPNWVMEFYQTHFDLAKYDNDPHSPKLVYINRKDSSQRSLSDEDGLIERLSKLGFVSVALSDYDMYGKIKLFRNADVIVSSTGAALATLFFAKNGTKVLEFFSRSFTHTHYYNVSTSLGLDYHYLIFDTDKMATKMREGITSDIVINVDAIVEKVVEMMEKNTCEIESSLL